MTDYLGAKTMDDFNFSLHFLFVEIFRIIRIDFDIVTIKPLKLSKI